MELYQVLLAIYILVQIETLVILVFRVVPEEELKSIDYTRMDSPDDKTWWMYFKRIVMWIGFPAHNTCRVICDNKLNLKRLFKKGSNDVK